MVACYTTNMSKEARVFLPQILWYSAIWLVVASALFLILRYRRSRLYSKEKYEALIVTISEKRQKATDPCQFFIAGDPPNAEGNFAKAIFYCDKEHKAVNTLDLSVLATGNYRELIREVGRINGFSSAEIVEGNQWKCFDDHERVLNFSDKIKLKSRVECFFNFSDGEIKTLYAQNN